MKPTISKLKKKADTLFSQYIRLKNSDWRGYCQCYTCGKIDHYKKMQCGHYEKRGNNATRYDEENCRVQCLTEKSNLELSNGISMSIKDILPGDKVKAFDEKTFKKRVAIVKSVNSFLPDKLYKVELENGECFFATGDHRVVSNNKWVEIKEMLHSCNEYDILKI